jgi:nucleoside 2-deoxyribosyltransferase
MVYEARVVKVMIASPGDVAKERQLVRDVIHEWNAVNAEDRTLVLMPIGWETHSSPDMGDRPQAIINKQLLKDSDLLVAIFWARLGTPTGVADSGTVEEINDHLATGKPAMIYFSTAPVHLDSVDSKQYEKLRSFKEDLRKRGLVHEYDDLTTFRLDFARHLAQTVIARFLNGSSGETEVRHTHLSEYLKEASDLMKSRPKSAVTEDARELLLEAVQDKSGAVMKLGTMGRTHVTTNGREFTEMGNVRSEARWRSAVDELHRLGFLEDRAGKGEVFFVTDAGYRAVDLLK